VKCGFSRRNGDFRFWGRYKFQDDSPGSTSKSEAGRNGESQFPAGTLTTHRHQTPATRRCHVVWNLAQRWQFRPYGGLPDCEVEQSQQLKRPGPLLNVQRNTGGGGGGERRQQGLAGAPRSLRASASQYSKPPGLHPTTTFEELNNHRNCVGRLRGPAKSTVTGWRVRPTTTDSVKGSFAR